MECGKIENSADNVAQITAAFENLHSIVNKFRSLFADNMHAKNGLVSSTRKLAQYGTWSRITCCR